MLNVGIVGANGFIGNRAVEILCAAEDAIQVRPIVRSISSVERFRGQGLECHVANALSQSALERAFAGCDVVIHSVLGNSGLIRGSVAPAYKAAQKVGVRRLIYLSSMCVYGQCPAPGTTEETPFSDNHIFPYNTAKIEAERRLFRLRSHGSVEIVIFRPGIVFGPRSRWVMELADQLLHKTAYLINDGQGICNTVYVDNLIHAMQLAMTAPAADGQAFFVGDQEQITWAEFYRPFAEALGVDPTQIPHLSVPEFAPPGRKQQIISAVRDSAWVQKVLALALVSEPLKRSLKQTFSKKNQSLLPSPHPLIEAHAVEPRPVVTQEMALLQQSQYKLPYDKAKQKIGYAPIVTLEQAYLASIQWLMENMNVLNA